MALPRVDDDLLKAKAVVYHVFSLMLQKPEGRAGQLAVKWAPKALASAASFFPQNDRINESLKTLGNELSKVSAWELRQQYEAVLEDSCVPRLSLYAPSRREFTAGISEIKELMTTWGLQAMSGYRGRLDHLALLFDFAGFLLSEAANYFKIGKAVDARRALNDYAKLMEFISETVFRFGECLSINARGIYLHFADAMITFIKYELKKLSLRKASPQRSG